jgi:hypothetical protein
VCVVAAPMLVWKWLRGWSYRCPHVVVVHILIRGSCGRESSGCTGVSVATYHRNRFPQHRGWLHSIQDGGTGPGLAAQGQGWSHRAGGDGGDVVRSPCVKSSSWAIVGSAAICLSRVLPDPFEGCGVEEGRGRVA